MKPYVTTPALKERIWGGSRLEGYNKKTNGKLIGESWETSLQGEMIPVLLKFIDAEDVLSVQVHPDDHYARKLESMTNGKSELWIVLEAEEGAEIVYGFRKQPNKQELRERIDKGNLESLLNWVNVKRGDCIYIPAGTVHALGKGLVVYEVQQTSDLTYRLYDWNRVDSEGKRRELHIEKALEVIDYQANQCSIQSIYEKFEKNRIIEIKKTPYFTCGFIGIDPGCKVKLNQKDSFLLSCIHGDSCLFFAEEKISIQKGDTLVIPKQYADIGYIKAMTPSEFLVTFV